jgi:hypothetical protein
MGMWQVWVKGMIVTLSIGGILFKIKIDKFQA